MKAVLGMILIIFSTISLFRYENLGRNAAETIGVLIGYSLFAVPGLLLISKAMKKNEKK